MENSETKPSSTPLISDGHVKIIEYYGRFMGIWSTLELTLQTAIMKELKITPEQAIIITGKLQFHPRAQLLINLLKHNKKSNPEAIKILQKTESFAHRNTIVHGVIVFEDPDIITFSKYDGGGSASQSFTPDTMFKHISALAGRIKNLQRLLDISDDEMQNLGHATLKLTRPGKPTS